MALNKYMHRRNPFKGKRIDFKELSSKHDFVRNAICNDDANGEIKVDFKSPAHLAAISRALLLDAFDLDVSMPLDRLIPTIPLRMNYILWIEDLLQNSSLGGKSDVRILDIGAGAVCIYGLLGAKINKWHFVATEIDSDNCATARANINRNNLAELVNVVQVCADNSDTILGPALVGQSYIDVVMCNPPFFSSATDKSGGHTTRNIDERDTAMSINTGHRTESVVEGGEVSFTKKLIDESIIHKDHIGIFTVMLGKKSSCDSVKHYLQSKSIGNYSIYEMCQGRVMRWGVAWSLLPDFAHPKSEFQLLKPNTKCTLSWQIPFDLTGLEEYSVNGVYSALKEICKNLDISYLEQRNKQSDGGGYHLLVSAKNNTWSHQRRRRRELMRLAKDKEKTKNEDNLMEPESKRRKLNDICDEGEAMNNGSECHSDVSCGDEFVLRCTINVVSLCEDNLPQLQLDFKYVDGDKESMNQILTYVKNVLKTPL